MLNTPQDCNVVLYNKNYATQAGSSQNALFATGTSGQGTGFCHVAVSSANGGSFEVGASL